MKLSELKKYIEENITEILGEAGLYSLKDPKKSAIGLSPTIDPDDNTENSPQFKSLYKKVAETKDEDEEVEDTYGKEDEDDKKDAKIKSSKPSSSDLKKNASIATVTDALAKVVKNFKETSDKYKKAKGEEKSNLLGKLKDLTSKKKTLEKALEKKEKTLK